MQILTVDIGTGSQDIFLYDSDNTIENGLKLVMPSPTMNVSRRIKRATDEGRSLLLTGMLMGGGPSQWATEAHIRAGNAVYATPQAARSFNDDLEFLQQEMGLTIVGEDEVKQIAVQAQMAIVEMKDFDLSAIYSALAAFGCTLELDAVGVAVFDHGNAPQGYSDRLFRFEYLDTRLRRHNQLSTFAFRADEVPHIMTRMQAVVQTYCGDAPLVVTDTAPAAIAGALLDPVVQSRDRMLIANVGNYHTLAFRIRRTGEADGLFEHHTGEVDSDHMDDLLEALSDSSLKHDDVYQDMGHGALIYDTAPLILTTGDEWGVAIIGPRRNLMSRSRHLPYFAVPYGDMMLSGCFGILRLMAEVLPEFTETIMSSLESCGNSSPWESV